MTLIITHKKTHVEIDCPCSLANSSRCFGDDDCCYLSGRYLKGKDKPNYPVPAIQYEAVFGSHHEECMYDTMLILRHGVCCEECGPYLEAICDFNWDRCMDFGTPHGEFYNARR